MNKEVLSACFTSSKESLKLLIKFLWCKIMQTSSWYHSSKSNSNIQWKNVWYHSMKSNDGTIGEILKIPFSKN